MMHSQPTLPPSNPTHIQKARLKALCAAVLVMAGGIMLGFPPTQAEPLPLDLSTYKGKVVYLDFWASWCAPCKASFPYMQRQKAIYGRDGLVVLTVNLDHSRTKADAFLKALNSQLDVVYDPKGDIARAYHVKDMPTSVLIDRQGRVRYVHNGFFPDQTADYRTQIEALLHEKS